MVTVAGMLTFNMFRAFPRAYMVAFERWMWTAYILFVLHAVAHLRWPVAKEAKG